MQKENYEKLPVEEKCVHKLWRARVNGYEEVTKFFRQIDDKNSPEFSKYLGLVEKFVVDSNVIGQEKGLEATLAYIENYAFAGKTVSEVMSGVVAKCIAAPQARTRELALQVTLMYIEIEKQKAVLEELLKGMDQKNPKIVSACINACTTALKEFGFKIVTIKPLLKKIGALFSHRDKGVRDEARYMVIEMYRWLGAPLRYQLEAANLQPIQITELEIEFAKIECQKATPTRHIRSQQQKQAKIAAETVNDDGEEEEQDNTPQEVDPYELANPVDILSNLPKDFYDKLEAKNWQERKEVLEYLENLLKTPKLENGDYGNLVRALKKVIEEDSSVICVALAGHCVANLSSGLKKRYQKYSRYCIGAILGKFTEKNQSVITALRDAIDAIYLTTTLEAILPDVLQALNNKSPLVKSETLLFLVRAFTKTSLTEMIKKLLKAITAALTKTVNESDPSVRESSAEVLGKLTKLVEETAIAQFLVELEKNNLKMSKIKENCDKAVETLKVPSAKKERPSTAPMTKTSPASNKQLPKKPAGKKKTEISSGSASVGRSKGKPSSKLSTVNIEKELSDEEVDDIIAGMLNVSIVGEIASSKWESRLSATEQIMTEIQKLDSKSLPAQALVKFLAKRPGLKDTNFQVLKAKLNIVKYLAENCTFSITTANCCVTQISEKFSDPKNGPAVAETLTAISEATTFGQISATVMDFAFTQKSPKVQQEALVWLSKAMKDFGFSNLNTKLLIDNAKKGLASVNPGVRRASITLLGTMYLYMGATLNVFFENEKPALRDQIYAECDKYEGEKPPTPTRGVTKSTPKKLTVPEKEEKVATDTKPLANLRNAVEQKDTITSKSAPPRSRKKDKAVDISPLLVVNDLKHQRAIDESELKVLQWNFTEPREEFVDLLRNQMTAANVNETLIDNMFHSDFSHHIKAIEALKEDLKGNSQALISNLDLILKWLTLRFFDDNPSVLLKAFAYLHSVFNILIETKYIMSENEASSFIPHLVNKIGDPKDSVRNGVKALLNQIYRAYPISRLFTYLMEGIKSENARQRAECLGIMETFIEDFGLIVFVPSPADCLKKIAKQVSDCDTSVTNAALNCIVHVFNIVGDKVFKMVENLSDEDMSRLEERIDRALKAKLKQDVNTTISPQKENSSPNKSNLSNHSDNKENEPPQHEELEEKKNLPLETLLPEIIIDGPFDNLKPVGSQLNKMDLKFLKEEIKSPSKLDAKANTNTRPILFQGTSEFSMTLHKMPTPKTQDVALEFLLKQTASQDFTSALEAFAQLHKIIPQPRGDLIAGYEDVLMNSIITQLRYLEPRDPTFDATVSQVYRNILTIMKKFYQNKSLGSHISVPVLKNLLNEMITLRVEEKLIGIPDGKGWLKLNGGLCTKIIERSDHTNSICALLQLGNECISNDSSARHVDLVMKGLWTATELLPKYGDEIDYDSVLLEAHNFLKKFPSTWWESKEDDMPLRIVKYILESSVKNKGDAILLHLCKIPNPAESEVESYVYRVLKSLPGPAKWEERYLSRVLKTIKLEPNSATSSKTVVKDQNQS